MTSEEQHRFDTARAFIAAGRSQAQAARMCGFTAPTLCRLLKEYAATGTVRAKYATGPRDNHTLTAAEAAAAKLHYLETRSRRQAAERLLEHRDCSAETARRLKEVLKGEGKRDKVKGEREDYEFEGEANSLIPYPSSLLPSSFPTWFTRATTLTTEERLAFRGPKALQSVEPARARGAFYEIVENDGRVTRMPLAAGYLWESDDQSENTPSVAIDPATGRAMINRQTLYTVDVYTAKILGFTAVSRKADSYTTEDQADMALELVDALGMPLAWRIERGRWDNGFWWGIKLPTEWFAGDPAACAAFRWGGLDVDAGGPVRILECTKSRHKGMVEGTFNHLQNLNAHSTLDMGRYRGEHERAAKMLRKVANNRGDGAADYACKVLPSQELRAEWSEAFVRQFNAEPKARTIFGGRRAVPDDLWAQRPALRPLSSEHRWRFLPVKRAVTMRNSHIKLQLEQHAQRVFWFTTESMTPEWDWHTYLPHGWRCFAAFHPLRLDLGCHLFNAVHPEDPANPGRFQLGMFLGIAPVAELAPMWREGEYDSDAFSERKQWESKVKRSSRIINDAKKGSIRSIMAADVAGRVTMSRQGAPDPLRNEGTREKVKGVRAEVEPAPVARRGTSLEPAPVIRPLPLAPSPFPLPTDPDPYRPTLAELEAEYEAEEAWR